VTNYCRSKAKWEEALSTIFSQLDNESIADGYGTLRRYWTASSDISRHRYIILSLDREREMLRVAS